MRLDRFWTIALFDRENGYYTTRDPFGTEGDFTTAPEISQMFGELIGAWLVAAWRGLGRPSPFLLCEIGPGRGTLMADILRSVRQLDPDMMRAARVRLVETSDRLGCAPCRRRERYIASGTSAGFTPPVPSLASRSAMRFFSASFSMRALAAISRTISNSSR